MRSIYVLFVLFLWSCGESTLTDAHQPIKKREKGYVFSLDKFQQPKEFSLAFQDIQSSKTVKKLLDQSQKTVKREKSANIELNSIRKLSSKTEDLKWVLCPNKPELTKAGSAILHHNNPFNIRHFNKTNGLKHQSVASLVSDKQGRIWSGTLDGLDVFDGKNFHHFSEAQGLQDAEVLCTEIDKNGNIWIGTRAGLMVFDGKKLHIVSSEYFHQQAIFALHTDKKGVLWVSSAKCIVSIENKKIQIWDLNRAYSLISDEQNRIWFDSDEGLFCIENQTLNKAAVSWGDIYCMKNVKNQLALGTKKALYFINLDLSTEKINIPQVTSLASDDRHGELWIGTKSGLLKLKNDQIQTFTEKEGLSDHEILSLCLDKQSILWVGTQKNGLNFFDSGLFKHYTTVSGFPADYHYMIFEDTEKQLFLGGKYGLIKWQNNQLEQFSFPSISIHSGIQSSKQMYWFGTNAGLLKYNGQTFQHFNLKNLFPPQNSEFVVTDILEDHSSNIWLSTTYGIACVQDNKIKIYTTAEGLLHNIVYDLEQDEANNIWIASEKGLSKYDGNTFTYYTEKEGFTSHASKTIKAIGKNIWIGTFGAGLIKYDGAWFEHYKIEQGLNSNHIFSIVPLKDEIWVGSRFGINKISNNSLNVGYGYEEGFLGLGCNGNAAIKDHENNIWFCTSDRLTKFVTNVKDSLSPSANILDLAIFGKSIDWSEPPVGVEMSHSQGLNLPEDLSLPYTLNYLTFSFNGITTRLPQKVQFQYKLEGFDSEWREITYEDKAHYTNLPSGKYQFLLKTANSSGQWSEPVNFAFRIRPPWWKTWWFLILVIICAVLSSFYYVRWREKTLREEQKRLQKIVEEQTYEIRAALEDVQMANEEINTQAEELKQQNDILHEQQLDIQAKNKQITDSLNYGKRIQEAMLPDEKWLKNVFPNSFVFLKPKDIVSGDFYWMGCVGALKIFAAVDCTGHGVPGAFMSMIGHELLNEIVLAKNIVSPDLILNELHTGVRRILKQHSTENYDGMDLSLVCIDEQKKEILFAGAQNPLYIIENDEFKIIPADKKSIGGKQKDQDIHFSLQRIPYQKDIQLFLASDGFQDQFGGNKGRKYMIKNFRELLFSLKAENPENQNKLLQNTLKDWMKNYNQMDDIIVVGIHLKV